MSSPVWTGMGGFAFSSCADWTSAASTAAGTTGSTQYATAAWQEQTSAACNLTQRLYCFEN
jgi:hypothetical protein